MELSTFLEYILKNKLISRGEMREMTLSLNENAGKQYESSPFPYMEVVPNMDGFSYMEAA